MEVSAPTDELLGGHFAGDGVSTALRQFSWYSFFLSDGEHKLRDAGTPPIFCLVLLLTLGCLGTIPSALLRAPPFGAENQEQDSEGRAWKCSSLRVPLSSSAQLLLL